MCRGRGDPGLQIGGRRGLAATLLVLYALLAAALTALASVALADT